MTTDLEARLSRAMHTTPDPAHLDVDPGRILADGRCAVRRRRAVLGSACAAVLTAIALVVGLGPRFLPQVNRSVPAATPSPAVATFDRLSMTTSRDGRGSSAITDGRWIVSFEPADRTIRVTAEAGDASATPSSREVLRWPEADVPLGPGGRAGFRSLGGGAILVVLPDGARSASTSQGSWIPSGANGPDVTSLGDSGLSVGVLTTVPAEAKRVVVIRWRQGDRVLDTAGRPYRSTRVPGTPDDLLWTGAPGEMGLLSSVGDTMAWTNVAFDAGILTSSTGSVSGDGSPTARATIFGLVPEGSTDVSVSWRDGWSGRELHVVTIPGRTDRFVVARAVGPAAEVRHELDTRGVVLGWTTPDGRRHTDR